MKKLVSFAWKFFLIIASILLIIPIFIYADSWTNQPSHQTLYADTITSKTDASSVNIADSQGLFVTGDVTTLGKVGIGTTGPNTLLHLSKAQDTTNARDYLRVENTGYSNAYIGIQDYKFYINNVPNTAGGFVYRIDNGNVGIGTANPQRLLHILKSDAPSLMLEETQAGEARQWTIGANANLFHISDVTAGAERVTINSVGNVGIGTTNPSFNKLRVTAANNQIGIEDNAGGTDRSWTLNADGNKLHITDETAAANRVSIDNAGNVGIGTTSPGAQLEITGAMRFNDGNNRPFSLQKTSANNDFRMVNMFDSNRVILSVPESLPQLRLFPNGDGNVGIGTTGPGTQLTIQRPVLDTSVDNPGVNAGLRIIRSGGTDSLQLGAGLIGGAYQSWIQSSHDGGTKDLLLQPNGGNVGIGSTNPGSKATVSGGDVYVSTSGNGIILKDTSNGNCYRVVMTGGVLTPSVVACPSS